MKRIFDEDLSLSDLKSTIKGLNRKKDYSRVFIGALFVLLAIAVGILICSKLRCCCGCDSDFDYDDDDFDDDFDDEDDDDEDFED
jgi:hypothetical protein